MGLAKEFRDFAMRGNVVDMAVGIIIGGAFGKIVSSVVNDVIMPPIGILIGGVDFTDLKIILKEQAFDGAGKVVSEAVYLRYGNFLQTTVDFLIIAFAVFLVIKLMNRMQKKEETKPAAPPVPSVPSAEEKLLGEIRDILKNK
jgi:large conductance mechanosensitive channel